MKVNPRDKWIKCLNKKLKVFPDAETYARLLAALYTGKKENIARRATIAQIIRSPLIFVILVLIL